MGFNFNFLKKAAHDVGHGVATVARGDTKPGDGAFGFLDNLAQSEQKVKQGLQKKTGGTNTPSEKVAKFAVDTARSVPRGVLEVGQTLTQPITHNPSINPADLGPVGKFVLGDKPVTTSTQSAKDFTASLPGHHNLPTPVAFPVGLALSSPIFGGKKNITEQLVKADTVEKVKKLIPGVEDAKAQAIASQKDPHVIENIVKGGNKVPSPAPVPPAKPTPSEGANAAGQGEAINKHLQTIRNADSTTPELQEAIKGMKQTHEMRSTQKLSDEARANVEKDYTGSLTKVLTAEKPSDKEVALGEHLIVKAQQEGRIGEAANVAEHLDNKLRESGRTVQAASIISRLSPEGQLLVATRQIRKAREVNPNNITREKNTAEQIQNELEATKLDKKAVRQTVNDVAKEPPTVGEQVAKNVAREVTPKVKQQADELVKELTKKIKQEHLEPKTSTPRPATDILKEVFSRNKEAQAAFPEAQRILEEKFKGNENALNALGQFFNSKLGLPAASSTINRSIQEQLKKNGNRVADIIHKSHVEQGQSVDEVAKALTAEGFDEQSAKTLATEVTNRLNKQLSEAKKSKLESLSKSVKSKNQPTYMEKISKLSNLGALDKQDYIHLARAKLNLPHLSTETAGKISELAQKLQGLPEGHDKYAVVREIQHLIGKEIPRTKGDLLKEFVGLPRTIMASGDFSFGGRQGLVYATSHPVKFAKAWPKQFEYFKQAFKGSDSEAYDTMMADIRNHEDHGLLEKYGKLLDPTGHDVSHRNEQFLSSDLAEKIPGIGKLVRGSNYAFTGLHNYLYANQFYGMVEHLKYAGIKPSEHELTQIAEAVGTALGRGGKKGGFTENHAGFFTTVLFAPRLIASRLNVMNPAYYIRLKGPARQEALRGLLGLSAFAGSVLGLAKLAGADVSTDPRSADFGKVKVGDTRFDVLGGFTQYIRLGTRLSTGQSINSTTGAQTEAGKGLVGSRLDIASNFIQGKENPSVSFVTDMLKGKDISGNSIYNAKGVTQEVASRFIPLLAQDINDLRTHKNSAGLGAGVAGLFGTGIQTYGLQDEPTTDKQKKYIDKLKKSGADPQQIKADENFFRFLKVGAGTKQNVTADIDKALRAKDTQKAQKLADDYNKKLSSSLQPWIKQYGSQSSHSYVNQDLLDAYHSRQISPSYVMTHLKNISKE